MLPERVDALVGSMLGKDYRVLQVIGTGGMAVVYLVEHQTLLKRFAAKVLSSDLASSAEARARFAQEAHAASQLDHENIVTISDFGVTADQRPFFVMELLRGQTLDQRLGDGPMSIEEVVAVAVPVARALAHAHAEGIVHRDVKPENIFLVQRSQGRWGVKVVDFGIAKTPINPKLTHMNETLGSPLFMAPEMIRGEDDVDQRTDVYSFGVLLYLMLCGRLPFFDENLLKVMHMHLASPVPPPRAVKPALSEELAQVLDRALAKHADDRYPSMDSLLIDLEAALPPGADRLLIEAQSGAARGETPFAATLAMPRESQRLPRITPSEPALRTMRVSPLPAPSTVLVTAQLPSAPPPRRVGIVVASALITSVVGVGVYWKLAGRPAHHAAAAGSPGPLAVAKPVPAAAPVAPAASEPAAAPTASAAPPPASEPASEPVVASAPAVRHPGRPRPGRRDPAHPGRRVASAVAGAAPLRAGAAAPADEPAAPAAVAAIEPAADREPAPEPAPAVPSPVSAAVPVGPGSLDAVPAIDSLDVTGSLSGSVVKRSLERALSSLRTCYQTAARAGNATPAVELKVRFEIDESGAATHVATSGTGFGSLASCAGGVLGGLHTQQAPDTGTAQVSVLIRYRPQ